MNLRIGEGFVWIDGHKICEGSQELFGNGGMEIPVFEVKQPIGLAASYGDSNKPIDRLIKMLSDPTLGCAGKPLDEPACHHTICPKCSQFHDPDLICHRPKENLTTGEMVATVGHVNQRIATLLERVALRFERHVDRPTGFSLRALVTELRSEQENWK